MEAAAILIAEAVVMPTRFGQLWQTRLSERVRWLFTYRGVDATEGRGQFVSQVRGLVAEFWRWAWQDGIAQFGLRLEDLTGLELMALNATISKDQSYVPGFGQYIVDNSAHHVQDLPRRRTSPQRWHDVVYSSPQWSKVNARMETWFNSYNAVVTQARQMAAGDRPMEWVLGPTEHCRDCLNYAGRVYRASTWGKWNVYPQHMSLACHGFRCQCRLMVTSSPLTPGRPPRMTG